MAGQSLVMRSVALHEGDFNWVFLIWYIVSAVLTILFLFYFNRLFASLVTYGIRAYTWHYYRVYVNIQALQVSLLAGRIFFKGIRYHGQNETILVHDGYVTWRYWLRHVQELDCQKSHGVSKTATPMVENSSDDDAQSASGRDHEAGAERKPRESPCRVLVKARGVEWFIYNRSPAYDAIFQTIRDEESMDRAKASYSCKKEEERSSGGGGDLSQNEQTSSLGEQKEERDGESQGDFDHGESTSISTNTSAQNSNSNRSPIPELLNLLPIKVECSKGAIVMGNRNTRSVLTAIFDSATGKIDARQSRAADQYKQTFDFDFIHPIIEFRHNKDFIDSQMSEGEKAHSKFGQRPKAKRGWLENFEYRNRLRHVWGSLRDFIPYHSGSVESFSHSLPNLSPPHNLVEETAGAHGQNRWLGLTRYLDEDDDLVEQERWKAIEYGQFPTIVDSPSISMSFYWDVPGLVPDAVSSGRKTPPGFETNINSDAPPDWGIELKIGGGTINYGPWADRQRADLQAVFFPTLYKDAVPATKLSPGQFRVSTALKVVLEIEEQITLRVPTREDSKDWRWKGHTTASAATGAKHKKTKQNGKSNKTQKLNQSSEVRPPGWIDVKILPDSTVSFNMDLVAGSTGYRNRVDLDLKGIEMSSSVNHGLLWRSKSETISCDISNPLGWNTLRQWRFDIHDNGLELFILRDHMFLLTDLINDWTSGPPGDFHTFVPFQYTIGLHFADFKLYLNANDSNIINDPSDFEDNTFVIIRGACLDANLVIPSKSFRPARSRVAFEVEARNGGLDLRTPPRNTQHTFLNSSDVASLKDLKINGSYNYFTTTSPSLTDTLLINVYGLSPRIDLYGFLIRYLMKIKDNYFGDDIHFRTLEEYQAQVNGAGGQTSEDAASAQHIRVNNDLDVILNIRADNSCALLPARLYSSDEVTRLEILSMTGDLRVTNYYMDLAVSSSPIAISHRSHIEHKQREPEDYSSIQVFIDGLEAFGHRLFGLPPTEPTYICNWDFDVGSISGECSIDFLRCLTMSLRCFGLTFDDVENALPPLDAPTIHDVTFLRARIRPILVGLHVDQAVFLLSTEEVEVDFNDWAGSLFSDHLHVLVPSLIFAVADGHGASLDRSLPKTESHTSAYMKTTIELNRVKRKQGFKKDRHLQQSHIALHDTRTHRVPWLIHEPYQLGASGASSRPKKTKPPAMQFPSMPEPTSAMNYSTTDGASLTSDTATSDSSRSTASRKSSFSINVASKRGNGKKVQTRQRQAGKLPRVKNVENDPVAYSSLHKGSTPMFTEDVSTNDIPKERTRTTSRADFAHSGLYFSSPYKRPYFPILTTKPDTRDVPDLPEHLASDSLVTDTDALESLRSHVTDRENGQASFAVNFIQGVQVFCTPEALFLVTQLLAGFQTSDVVNILDNLQIDAMTDVLDAEERRRKESQITDVRVFMPWVAIRFVNTNSRSLDTAGQERYDITLDNLTATATSSNRLLETSASTVSPHISVHVNLNQMNCSARESVKDKADDQAIITLAVRDIVFWMWHGATSAAEMQFEKLEIISASRKIDYVSSLICQTLVLSEDLARRFTKLEEERTSRTRLLVLLLTTKGTDVPDPPFLTRVSYVLRSASHHLRTDDSWKMMSRLRFLYHCLPARSQEDLRAQCIHILASCPHDAGKRVIASFDRWRSWDLGHVESSLLMQRVYGQLLNKPSQALNISIPLKATVRAGGIQILVEPGPRQNEIAIKGLVVGLDMNQPLPSSDSPLPGSPDMLKSSMQAYCVEVAVRLNWTLLGLIENVFETVRATTSPKLRYENVTSEPQPSLNRHCLQIVISSEMSILNCDTPDLKIISLCQSFKTSFVASGDSTGSQGSSTSLLMNADAATSEIETNSTMLALYKLRRLRIFGAKNKLSNEVVEGPWKFVCTGQDVLFQVLANPLQLIEATDCFLEHEVAHIFKWVKSLQPNPSPARSPVTTATKTGLLKIQISFFLESYLIILGVLPSLTYSIKGTGVRSSIKSGLRGKHDLEVDYGLREHSHVFETEGCEKEVSNVLSTLRMPSINGRISLDLAPSQHSIDFHALVESIVFDASAVHAILTAINRPEIISLGTSISHEASVLQSHYDGIFDIQGSNDISKPSEPILYSANVILVSLAVHARTSDSLSIAQGAELQFEMSRMQLKAMNRDTNPKTAMKFPNLGVQLRGINLNLLRSESFGLLPCGDVAIKAMFKSTSKRNDAGKLVRTYQLRSSSLQMNIYAETAPVLVAILVHLQDTLKTVDLSQDVQNLRKLGRARRRSTALDDPTAEYKEAQHDARKAALFSAMYSLEMTNISVIWRVECSTPISPGREPENLILSFTKIDLATKKDNAARLLIENFQLQMVAASKTLTLRSLNSALLPEVVFNVAYVSTAQDRRLAFQAAGKSLDLQLTSQFILPANDLRRSIASSIQQVRSATADWNASIAVTDGQTKRLLCNKKLASLLVDADFAGAVVHIQGRSVVDTQSLALNVLRGGRLPQHGRYNQFTPENSSNSSTTLRAPGIAFKVQYKNVGPEEQSLYAELKVDASSNILYPTVVPLIMEISSSVKDIVGEPTEQGKPTKSSLPQPKFLEDERLRGADPSAIFGNCRLNLGLRICRQEFSLSCQPIARVAATARFEDIYVTVNTVHSKEHGKFFTVSGAFKSLQASVQHVYSRESTGSFEVDSVVVSLMNSKHVSTVNGISAILKISPMKAQINGKQSQDFLLFREIWVPPEIRRPTPAATPVPASESHAFIVQRYQQIAATGAFPWNATVSIAELDVQVDLGQSLGKSAFVISKFWVSSKKTSDWEQNLCLGFDRMAVDSTGRMSGFVELQDLKVRTSIHWPVKEKAHNQTPLVQASLAFEHLRVKAAFDYQAFAIADITRFEFLMYNVRDLQKIGRDRLVGVLDGDKVQVFCTTTSASQAIALYQAFQRLHQDKVAAYQTSLRDIEKFLRRKSSINPLAMHAAVKKQEDKTTESAKSTLQLQTDVVVTLKAVNIGAFPSTFFDNQIFKLEALDASARFAVVLDNEKVRSSLGMILGQLRIALAGITRASVPKTLGEVSIADVVASATGSRGGTILKVPKLVATMETWQNPESTQIDYIFKSSFQGKVDVGWNYSRISYIRGMWTSHARALAQRLGKPLPQSAVQITGGPRPEGDEGSQTYAEGEQGKITAVVNVPQSKYQYIALQPPIIETPQLRDMGEATPPLEWIGLHRDRLPNLTHQIVIVTLLEVAKEVDDAYSRILGST